MNNMGSTTLLHPVFNNLEQVIIFWRVVDACSRWPAVEILRTTTAQLDTPKRLYRTMGLNSPHTSLKYS